MLWLLTLYCGGTETGWVQFTSTELLLTTLRVSCIGDETDPVIIIATKTRTYNTQYIIMWRLVSPVSHNRVATIFPLHKLLLTSLSLREQSVISFSFPVQKKWYLNWFGVPGSVVVEFTTLPVWLYFNIRMSCATLVYINTSRFHWLHRNNSLITVLPGFSCLQATVAWPGPHRLGHSVLQLPLTQMYRMLVVLLACNCPISHSRLATA